MRQVAALNHRSKTRFARIGPSSGAAQHEDLKGERHWNSQARVTLVWSKAKAEPKTQEASMATAMAGSHERRETYDLIGSDKVEGTDVYRSNGERIGEVERVMLDKRTGKVAYAVMSFGGFLGLGHDHYPVPWERLTYNEKLGGYEVNISDQELKGAPKYGETEWSWDREQGRKIHEYYQVPPYWM
jgi:hypothetical protein